MISEVASTECMPSQASIGSSTTRGRIVAVCLLLASAVVGHLCYRLLLPFLPALAWALALAIIAHPMHRWIRGRINWPNLSAGLSVLIVALLVVGPAAYVTRHLVHEVAAAPSRIEKVVSNGGWQRLVERNASLKSAAEWWTRRYNEWSAGGDGPSEPGVSQETDTARAATNPILAERATDIVTQGVGTVLSGGAWVVFQLFITLMTLFFFFRDRHLVLDKLRSLLPISSGEAEDVFARINDTIHATIYGSILVALIQGTMGGLMFWWLDLPSPLLWGAIMALLAVVPVLGTFVIWAPTAAWLALTGEWPKALLLAGWGALAIGLIDNLIYPLLVGKRMHFHTLLVFFAIVGGISVFGACGVILGPVVLALADALVEIWRRRMASLMTIERGIG